MRKLGVKILNDRAITFKQIGFSKGGLKATNSMTGTFTQIGKREFSLSDQLDFSDFSGDINPIHIDPLEARKTIAGGCVVHGVNGVLWALECLLDRHGSVPSNLKIEFLKPIFIETQVNLFWNELTKKIKIVSEKNDVLVTISYDEFTNSAPYSENVLLPTLVELQSPKTIIFEKLNVGAKYKSAFGGKLYRVQTLYSQLSQYIGANTVYEVSTLSNIVGMQIPGLHSLFSKLEISLVNNKGVVAPFYKVVHKDERFRSIELLYTGRNLTSKIVAFERPHQEPKRCSEIKKLIPATIDLKEKRILIIGGSRGIGATFARVSSMLGAHVTITYSVGAIDAKKVCADIKSHCNAVVKATSLDVTNLSEIDSFNYDFDILCYFASPKISSNKGDFDLGIFDNFYSFYCKSFEKIALRFSNSGGALIYWPSTIFLEQKMKGFDEYILAKEIGEKVCKNLENETNLKIIIERLEKIETDQTLSIMRQRLLDTVSVSINIATLLGDHSNSSNIPI